MALPPTLLPVDALHVERMHLDQQQVVLTVTSTQPDAVCPRCQTMTTRVHSRYTRTVADVSCVGHTLTLHLARAPLLLRRAILPAAHVCGTVRACLACLRPAH